MEKLLRTGSITVFGGQKNAIIFQLNELGLDYNYCQVLSGVWEINLK